jgi:uncharacterized protein YbjT (DUF2867 family)
VTKDSSLPDRRRIALVLGATGLVGRHLLAALRREPRYGRVVVLSRRALPSAGPAGPPGTRGEVSRTEVSRRAPAFVVGSAPPGNAGPAVDVHQVDFDALDAHAGLFGVDDIFCCLGTTLRKAGSREAFRRVDLDYPLQAARLGRAAGARQFLLVSAVGADPSSRVFYNRAKGEVEAAVAGVGYPRMVILRPSLLLGKRRESRPGERVAEWIMRPLGPLMRGPLARYRPVEAEAVARAMVRRALDGEGRAAGERETDGPTAASRPPEPEMDVEVVESDRIQVEGRAYP